jgi:hypothetical protein
MRHQRVEEWESKLNDLLKQVDSVLEEKFGSQLPLHPARAARDTTANPQLDGLFRVNASFTAGFGSKLGKGYVIQIDTVTLESLPAEIRRTIEQHAVELIHKGLVHVFPGKDLKLKRDGPVWKIVGDLTLPK